MTSEKTWNEPCWYVIHTHPRQEDRATSILMAGAIETFTPKVMESRRNQYTGELTQVVKHLFSRYIFARFTARDALHKVRFTRGVHCVVSFDNAPIPVDDEIIRIIRSRTDKNGYVALGEEIRQGDEVTVKAGPLTGFVGIFERQMKDSDRVIVMLNTVSYQGHLIIQSDLVKKVG